MSAIYSILRLPLLFAVSRINNRSHKFLVLEIHSIHQTCTSGGGFTVPSSWRTNSPTWHSFLIWRWNKFKREQRKPKASFKKSNWGWFGINGFQLLRAGFSPPSALKDVSYQTSTGAGVQGCRSGPLFHWQSQTLRRFAPRFDGRPNWIKLTKYIRLKQ